MPDATLHETAAGLSWTMDELLARASHALAADGRVWLVDPVDDAATLARVAQLGEPAAVLQLLDRHNRDAAAIAARLGVPHLRIPSEVPGSPFQVVPLLSLRMWREVALWWPDRRALVVAEALGTSPTFGPSSPGGAGVHPWLRLAPPRRLRVYDPDVLLVGHGAPIEGPAAAEAVLTAVDRSMRDLPRLAVDVPRALWRGRR